MTDLPYRKIERALARQRHDAENHPSTLDRAAQESCASLRIADLANVLSDTVKDSERRLVKHVHRVFAHLDANTRPERERITNAHRRLTELERQMRALAKAKEELRLMVARKRQ